MTENLNRGGPRPGYRRNVVTADNPTAPTRIVDCSDAETAIVAAKFNGQATQVMVQLETEFNIDAEDRLLLGDPFRLSGSSTFGAAARIDHAGVHLRAQVIATTPYALGLGTPSPLQTKNVGYAVTGVGAHGDYIYAADGTTVMRYLARDWSEDTSWTLTMDAANTDPESLWVGSSGVLIADRTAGKLFAYGADGSRAASSDLGLVAANAAPSGVWSDGTHVWVVDGDDNKVYVYTTAGAQVAASEFSLTPRATNSSFYGCVSDETTFWVLDVQTGWVDAYVLADGTRDMDKDFMLTDANWRAGVANANGRDLAILNEDTILVGDYTSQVVYAYGLLDGSVDLSLKAGPRRFS